ncbi:MAG: MlaD family protein [Cyanobacteria bacterium RUI128]|nr:MlaD family protein [Cyanobacteria bacterium RUI128]
MDKEDRKNRTSRLRRQELIVWLIILFTMLTVFTLFWIKHEEAFVRYTIYMPDVDGLIVGSPVHVMGIPIGYVTKTKIINDNEVKVVFKLTNHSVKLPRGTIATVEFSGLGGSKSLELYTPDSGKVPNELVGKNEYIYVDRPKRLRDSMALLYQMYKTLMNIIYTVTLFGHEMSGSADITQMEGKKPDFSEFLDYADSYMNVYEQNRKKLRSIMFKDKKYE